MAWQLIDDLAKTWGERVLLSCRHKNIGSGYQPWEIPHNTFIGYWVQHTAKPYWEGIDNQQWEPTHWMPLPPPHPTSNLERGA